MELGPLTKLHKRKSTMPKTMDNDVISENCDIIIIFLIYSPFGAIWKLDSRPTVCKNFLIVTLYFTKTENSYSFHTVA